MRDEWKEIIQEEMMKDAERIMDEVNADPSLKDVIAPEEIHEKLFAQIHEYERQRVFEQLSEEDKELIRLGKVYKKRRKWTKYLILVAAVLAVLGLGTVCIGEGEKVFSFMSRLFSGGDQRIVDSKDVEPIQYLDEDEAYEKIKKEYGFSPVRLEYLPNDTVFCEAVFSTEMQSVNMIYMMGEKTGIKYIIRPNYRESSFGIIVEDEKMQEYTMVVDDVEISLTQYKVVKTEEHRWNILFVYQEVQYIISITGAEQKEVEKIVNNLGF